MGKIVAPHIELRENRDGQLRPFVEGTRVSVQDIYFLVELEGKTADRVVTELPSLTLAQVHAALSYYFDHRDDILQQIRDDDAFAEGMRARLGPGPLERNRMRAHASGDDTIPS